MRLHTHARTQARTVPLYTQRQVPAPTQQVGPQCALALHRLCSHPISFLGGGSEKGVRLQILIWTPQHAFLACLE